MNLILDIFKEHVVFIMLSMYYPDIANEDYVVK